MTILKVASLLLCCLLTPAQARIQFYGGLGIHRGSSHHKVNFKNDYWNKKFCEIYEEPFKKIKKDFVVNKKVQGIEIKPFTISHGSPLELFERLLDDQSSELMKQNIATPQFEGTLGIFCFRNKAVLLAVEMVAGRASGEVLNKGEMTIFKAEPPKSLLDAKDKGTDSGKTAEVDLNPFRNMEFPLIHLNGLFTLTQETKVKRSFYYKIQARIGTVIKDRVYVFALVGAETNKLDLFHESSPKTIFDIILFFCSEQDPYKDTHGFNYMTIPLQKELKENLQKTKRICKKNRFNAGVVGGAGLEFFVTRRFSLRSDFSYTYCSEATFQAKEDKLTFSCTDTHWRVGLGLFLRF
ncbi:hypothetical protein AGMMS49949_03630 [Alphaproteobacteria bacterium]|nr:hypothetical protein AGMMS49949_03630 [Alphaproteobacteria bacterium]GHS96411.1 hypothetical protein AGMMS50296_2520 [Alphaproteobacteria bacterium]